MKENRWPELFLFLSVLLGGVVRFSPTILSGMPINDGGMFYVMIEDLKANHFLIPAFTTYNHFDIPFAYPPFSFYVGGVLSLIGVPLPAIFRWLPPLVSTLSIPIFYWIANLILKSKMRAALATLAYSLMPRTFSWYVMGGGLSRAFGIFFLLSTCSFAWMLFNRRVNKYVFLTALFGAGTVLSHPETGIHAAVACSLIWFANYRNDRSYFRDAVLVVLGVLFLTSPWWGIVLAQNGLAPFQSALATGGHTIFFWLSWLTLDFAEERFIALLTVLGLIGFVVQIVRKEWLLPIWMLIPFAIEPRSAPAIAVLPLAMLAGIGLSDVVMPRIMVLMSKSENELELSVAGLEQRKIFQITLAGIILISFFGAYFYDMSLSLYVVPTPSQLAMDWVRSNTLSASRFIVLTGEANPYSDPFVEWFPVYAGRTSLNTIQGREWTLGKSFEPFLMSLADLQGCVNGSPACVEDWAISNHLVFDYIYIEKPQDNRIVQMSGLLLYQLRQDSNYSLIFENDGAAIFERK